MTSVSLEACVRRAVQFYFCLKIKCSSLYKTGSKCGNLNAANIINCLMFESSDSVTELQVDMVNKITVQCVHYSSRYCTVCTPFYSLLYRVYTLPLVTVQCVHPSPCYCTVCTPFYSLLYRVYTLPLVTVQCVHPSPCYCTECTPFSSLLYSVYTLSSFPRY